MFDAFDFGGAFGCYVENEAEKQKIIELLCEDPSQPIEVPPMLLPADLKEISEEVYRRTGNWFNLSMNI